MAAVMPPPLASANAAPSVADPVAEAVSAFAAAASNLTESTAPDAVEEGTPASTVALVGLFVLAVVYTLYIARVLLLPVVLAILTSFILWPVVRALRRLHIPESLGALIVLAALAGGVGWSGYALSGPATSWLQTAPQAFHRIEQRVRVLKDKVQDVRQATDQVEKLTTVGETPQMVTVQGTGLGVTLMTGTWNLVAAVGVVLVLTYFLLASGDLFLRKLISALPTFREKKRVVAMSREMQDSVSAYLFTVSLINAGLGVAVGLAMAARGLPNPVLWGALAAVLNYIPYIGAATGIGIVTAVSIVTFDTLAAAAVAPALYLLLTTIEANFVTPVILSRRFTLNPVVVLLGLLFWGWIWGIPGALLAVPLLVTLRIFCDYVPSLRVLGEFLGD